MCELGGFKLKQRLWLSTNIYMHAEIGETQAKTMLLDINKYLHVCGKLGDPSLNNVNGFKQVFTCICELGGTQAKTTLMAINK